MIQVDTLAYVKKSQKTGVPMEQAEAHAVALAETLKNSTKCLATKSDLELTLAKIDGRFNNQLQYTNKDEWLDKLDKRCIKIQWILGINLALTTSALGIPLLIHLRGVL